MRRVRQRDRGSRSPARGWSGNEVVYQRGAADGSGRRAEGERGPGAGAGAGAGLGLQLVALLLQVVSAIGAAPRPDCVISNGLNYRGEQQITSQGEKCLNWMGRDRDYNVTLYPDSITGVGDHHFCRNPDGEDGPWCYVKAPGEGRPVRHYCSIGGCNGSSLNEDLNPTIAGLESVKVESRMAQIDDEVKSVPSQSDRTVEQPAIGISQHVGQTAKQKKDLGILGQALAIGMIVIIIMLGAGITLGYIYKRGRDLKKEQEQRACEREMHRIMLPLSAFSNPGCELVDEVTVVIENPQTQTDESRESANPLVGPAGTPGA
ncbi:phosphoinositide-3-kinase-interacting protein 1 [Heptranchias perlo]|uniref:phosphoinositide-3-kinase-interacting protein 1 n=1 Tax=Heptranchias perlo TaxID=212740 RepID=UPI00355A6150